MPTTPPAQYTIIYHTEIGEYAERGSLKSAEEKLAQYTISEYPVSRLLFASHICSKGFHKAFLPCTANLQSLPFYGYDQLIHTLHMRQIYQITVVALIVMPLRELFLGAFQ